MKSRLGASISSLFSGERRSSICKAISVNPKFSKDRSNLLLLQGFESLQRSFFSSADEEDGFSELGPPVAQSTDSLLTLVTEKPEPFMKTGTAIKATAGRSSAESIPSVKDIFRSLGQPSPTIRPKLENQNDISRFTVKSKDASNFKSSCSISIENVPSAVNLLKLIEAISIFGKISSISTRTLPNGLNCCDVKFENVESSRKAVYVGGITVGNFHLPICPIYVPETVTIRIKSINKKTADSTIHSMCKSIGALEGMARAREDVVDAFFSSKDESDTQSLLKKLNSTFMDDSLWSAQLLPRNSISAALSKTGDSKRQEMGLQITNGLMELKRLINMKRIYAEDLEYIYLAIMHLEDQPVASN